MFNFKVAGIFEDWVGCASQQDVRGSGAQQFVGEFDNNSTEPVFRNGLALVSIFDSEPRTG
jgi:hypothetical protein